jgi:predicted NBD/HSP70 family sugar kinase
LEAAGLRYGQVDQVVIATPGVIDPRTGALRHARHLHGWEEPGLREALEHDLRLPVSHGNDVNLAAVAEGLQGSAQDRSDYALLWLDRGVGLGLVSGGRIRVGAHGGAGEIGYLPAPGLPELPRVDRGAAGAFQQLAGLQGIRALAKEHDIHGASTAEIVEHAARAGEDGEAFLAELASRIAIGAAAVAALIDPELIILGGPVAHAGGSRLLGLVGAGLGRLSFVCPPLALSALGDDGVLTGALEVALQDVRSRLFGQPMAALLG